MKHTPVLLQETIQALDVKPGGKYIDATFGYGGHTMAIVEAGGEVLALDWDKEHVEKIKQEKKHERLQIVQGNYADIKAIAKEHNFTACEGCVFDLGLSMGQIATSERGFSHKVVNEPLDMRIGPDLEMTAADIINSYSVNDLYETFARNAEEINSRPIAEALANARRVNKITTVGELKEALGKYANNDKTLARIFQALRIEVNNEYDNIRKGLEGARYITKSGGKIAIISFHPSEDRIIKQFARKNGVKFTTKKPITADKPRRFERSAKLRVITN